jgi:hypothetical protein
LIYQNTEPGQSGHIAFIANSGLTLTTLEKLSDFEGKRGDAINRKLYWPIVAQAGKYTGIASIVFATNGYNGLSEEEGVTVPTRSILLRDSLYFYRVRRAAQ